MVLISRPRKKFDLPSLDIKPLSVAKFFYERGIELNSTMQDLLYLSYLEVIKKERHLLFTEEFQAWRAGPTLGSVFLRMHNHFRRHQTYKGLFEKYSSIDNEEVIGHLENIYQQYKKHKQRKRELTFAEKAKDRAWKITRKPLNDSLKYQPIKLETITNYLRI